MTPTVDWLPGSSGPLAEAYPAVLFDLDGVVYAGQEAVPGAAEVLDRLRRDRRGLAFVTNNAARTPQDVAAHLRRLGLSVAPADVVTSAQAAAALLAEMLPPGARVLVIGGDGLQAALADRGLRAVRSAQERPDAVVQGYSPDVGWRQLAEGAYALARGLPWVASNVDPTIPTGRGIAPGNGSLVEVLRLTTGRSPVVAGKPEPGLLQEAVARLGGGRPLLVGDRVDTDVVGATRAGLDSLLVLTGVSTPADVVLAPEGARPAFLGKDLSALLVAHPRVSVEAGTSRCGGWAARIESGRLTLNRDGAERSVDGLDGLRAACAAAWVAGWQPDEDGRHDLDRTLEAVQSGDRGGSGSG